MRHCNCDFCQRKSMNSPLSITQKYQQGTWEWLSAGMKMVVDALPQVFHICSCTFTAKVPKLQGTISDLPLIHCASLNQILHNLAKNPTFFYLEHKRSTDSCRDFKSIKACNTDDSQIAVLSHSTNAKVYAFYYSFLSQDSFTSHATRHNQNKTATSPATWLCYKFLAKCPRTYELFQVTKVCFPPLHLPWKAYSSNMIWLHFSSNFGLILTYLMNSLNIQTCFITFESHVFTQYQHFYISYDLFHTN